MNWHQLLTALAGIAEAAALNTTGTISNVLHIVAVGAAYMTRTSQVSAAVGKLSAKIPGKAEEYRDEP